MPKVAGALHHALAVEFGSKLVITSGPYTRGRGDGAFEVTVGGKLIHSKLTLGQGKVQTEEELDAIIQYIEAELARRRTAQGAATAAATAEPTLDPEDGGTKAGE